MLYLATFWSSFGACESNSIFNLHPCSLISEADQCNVWQHWPEQQNIKSVCSAFRLSYLQNGTEPFFPRWLCYRQNSFCYFQTKTQKHFPVLVIYGLFIAEDLNLKTYKMAAWHSISSEYPVATVRSEFLLWPGWSIIRASLSRLLFIDALSWHFSIFERMSPIISKKWWSIIRAS